MTTTQSGVVLRHIRGLIATDTSGHLGDRQLLERFAVRHDQSAFEALLRRHGPMVHGVCRRVLGNAHDAEDAFQATFLVLASRADSIGQRESVGGWLYQVAYNTALKAKVSAAARRRREQRDEDRQATDPLADITGRELLAVLDEELQRLPERYRAPLVLCYLEGATRDEAANRLGSSESTVKRRLEEGRERPRLRLERRGLALSAALLAAGVSGTKVSPILAAATARAALVVASENQAGVSVGVASLMGQSLRAISAEPRKAVAAALLAVTLIAAAAGLLGHRAPAEAGGDPPQVAVESSKRPADERPAAAPVNPREMIVTGQVLKADGKPAAEVPVAVVASPYVHRQGRLQNGAPQLLGQSKTDKDGRYRLTVLATSSQRHYLVKVIASAPGQGLGQVALDPNSPQQDETLRLPAEQSIRGRLIDLQGEPVAGVEVRVHRVWGQQQAHLLAWLSEPVAGLQAWPAAVKSDAQGRFEIGGLAPGLRVTLRVADDRLATQDHEIDTRSDGRPAELTWPVAPAVLLEGTALRGDTGEPLPHARISVTSVMPDKEGGEIPRKSGDSEVRADERGRFRIRPVLGTEYFVAATAPPGEPYLSVTEEVRPPKGTVRHTLELRLPRGLLVRGKVKEAHSGKPVAGAVINFQPRIAGESVFPGRPHWNDEIVSGPDGSFVLAVASRNGLLLAKGPTADFIHKETNDGQFLSRTKDAGHRYYPDGIVALDLKTDAESADVEISLRRGVTLQGRLVGPDGKPVKFAWMYCPTYIPLGYAYSGQPVAVRDGRFEIPGIDPDGTVRVCFYDGEHELGATVELSGKQAAGAVAVEMKPCGAATVRFVDDKGKPLGKRSMAFPMHVELVVTPGELPSRWWGNEPKGLTADTANGGHLVRWTEDDAGRATLGRLVPGATYRLYGPSSGPRAEPTITEFVVEAGKTRELPDVPVKAGK